MHRGTLNNFKYKHLKKLTELPAAFCNQRQKASLPAFHWVTPPLPICYYGDKLPHFSNSPAPNLEWASESPFPISIRITLCSPTFLPSHTPTLQTVTTATPFPVHLHGYSLNLTPRTSSGSIYTRDLELREDWKVRWLPAVTALLFSVPPKCDYLEVPLSTKEGGNYGNLQSADYEPGTELRTLHTWIHNTEFK